MSEPDFHCHTCGAEIAFANDPPLPSYCETCCEDHDYKYDSSRRGCFCQFCDRERPFDWDTP